MQKFLILLKTDYTVRMMIIGAVLMCIPFAATSLIGNSIVFTAFDCLGFFYVLQRRQIDGTEDGELIAAYRVMQLAFQIAILYIGFIHYGFLMPVAQLAWHFSGINDLLFYKLLKQRIPESFTWLWWTPTGFVYEKLLKRPTPLKAEYLQALVGLIISFFIISVR